MTRNPVAIGYARVSTTEQSTDGVSLDAQTERIESYCRAVGLELREVITDPGVSGGKPLGERPGGAELLREVKAGGVAAVVAVKLDRLFRSALDALKTLEDWEKMGIATHLIDQGGAVTGNGSAIGKLLITMLAGVAELERGLISERTKAALAYKKANLEPYSPTPLGYQRQGDRLIPDAREAQTIRLILDLRGQGYSYRAIAAELRRRRIPTKRGGRWEAATVRRIVVREGASGAVAVGG